MKNGLQKAIDQIGELTILRYLPRGMRLHYCDLHGGFLSHYKTEAPVCPLCIKPDPKANGTTATDVEHYIDLEKLSTKSDPFKNNTSGDGLHG